MTFTDVCDLLASRGLVGRDAETAFASWQRNPHGADGRRVQTILKHAGVS